MQPEPFKNLAGVSIIPLADGRGFLALEAGRGVSDLELAVIDRLESRESLNQRRTGGVDASRPCSANGDRKASVSSRDRSSSRSDGGLRRAHPLAPFRLAHDGVRVASEPLPPSERQTLSVLVPVYNERATIEELLTRVVSVKAPVALQVLVG